MYTFAGTVSPGSTPLSSDRQHPPYDRAKLEFSSDAKIACFHFPGGRVRWTPSGAGRPTLSWSGSGRVAVIFAGEEFSSTIFHNSVVAQKLADDYEQIGIQSLLGLNGWFSGAVMDMRDGSIVLFNDRYGRGRVYYHESAKGLCFASEARTLLADWPALRQIDPRGLAEFFLVGCVLQNRSIFAGIQLLPPGSAWTFRRGARVEKLRYFDPSIWERQETLSAADYLERLQDTFARIAPRYASGESRIAISLTGGLDSRAVLACVRAKPNKLPCFTFAGPYRDCHDVVIARRLAALSHQPHTTIRIGEDFFSSFSSLAERTVCLSDGTMDVSGAVELYVNQQARQIAPVRLTGNYGSEILRAHVAFRPGRLDRSLFTGDFNGQLDAAGETYRAEAACPRLTFIAFKQVPWHHQARFSIERSQLTPRSPFLDNELVALAYQAPAELASNTRPLFDLIGRGNARFAHIGTDRGLRARNIPLLSPIERSWKTFTVKAEYACDYGMPVWLARATQATSRLRWETLFLGRHKFYHFRVWYRDRLAAAVRAACTHDAANLGNCYRDGTAQRLADEHLSGRRNRTLELHQLLTTQLIERLFLRQT